MVKLAESRLEFVFQGDAIKFDDTEFYTIFKSHQPNGKGVDFLSKTKEAFIFLEVKNCTGYERENVWRTRANYSNEDGEESFDIEVSKKVEGTIACLVGAGTSNILGKADTLKPYFDEMCSKKYEKGKKSIQVILFLEGEFGMNARDKKMIMKRIQDSIRKKLKWLNCKVKVVDMQSYTNQYFEVNPFVS